MSNERGPFTGEPQEDLKAILLSISDSPLPVEVFDAFLAEYARTKDLQGARFFAQCEWDC